MNNLSVHLALSRIETFQHHLKENKFKKIVKKLDIYVLAPHGQSDPLAYSRLWIVPETSGQLVGPPPILRISLNPGKLIQLLLDEVLPAGQLSFVLMDFKSLQNLTAKG
jgi:hypothetical protein